MGAAPAAPAGVPARRRFGQAEPFALLAGLSFLAARFLPLLDLPYACPWKALLGWPCATCGMTHAFVHLAHGQPGAALSASPLGALLAAGAWAFAAADALRLAAGLPLPRPGPRVARGCALASAAALLANWAFLVIAHRA
jgi:hypothetical protein